MVLTTVNPRLPKHWWRLIALISLVYAAEAAIHTSLYSSQERGSGLSSTCLLILPFIYDDQDNISKGNVTLGWDLSIFSSLHDIHVVHAVIFTFTYCVHIRYKRYPVPVFSEAAWTLKQAYQITHIVHCLYSIIVFQNPLNHIRVVGDISVYLEIVLCILCSS